MIYTACLELNLCQLSLAVMLLLREARQPCGFQKANTRANFRSIQKRTTEQCYLSPQSKDHLGWSQMLLTQHVLHLQLGLPSLLFLGKAPFLFIDGYIYVDGYIVDPKSLHVSSTSATTSCTADRAWLISLSVTYYPVPSIEATVKLE